MESLDAESLKELWELAGASLNLRHLEDHQMAVALLTRLAQIDPQSATALAAETGAWRDELQREVAAAWAVIDLEPALAWISGCGSNLRIKAMHTAIERIGDTDRQAAIAIFKRGIEEGLISATSWETGDFFREWVGEDPQGALEAALDLRSMTQKDDALYTTVTAMGVTDPETVRAWLESETGGASLGEPLRNRLKVSLLDGWAERSPREAAEYMATITDPATAGSAAKAVLSNWAAQSFEDAVAWINSLDDSRQRDDFEYRLLLETAMHGDRTAAFQYGMARLPEQPGLSHAIYMLASGIVGDDPKESIPWAEETFAHEPKLQQEVYNTLLHQMRWQDPSESAKHLDLLQDPIRRGVDYEFHTKQWAQQDLDAAREWANNLPDSPDRDRALIGVAQEWMWQEPEETAAWIETLEKGELRDRITSHFVSHMREKDIARALEMAESLDDPYRRDDSLEYVMGAWLEEDPTAAREAIEAHETLSKTAKWRLLEGGGNDGG